MLEHPVHLLCCKVRSGDNQQERPGFILGRSRGILRDYTLDPMRVCRKGKIESELHGDMQTAIEIVAAHTKVWCNTKSEIPCRVVDNYLPESRVSGSTEEF